MKRRQFAKYSALMAFGGIAPVHIKALSISPMKQFEEITISELLKAYRQNSTTVSAVVRYYLDRIENIDQTGPGLNSVLQINPDVMNICAQLDVQSDKSAPLFGIPVLLKDNIDTADQMNTTGGSIALASSHPLQDSWVASKLRKAGAVILGKANLSEWANFRSKLSSSGWSGIGGQTKNPYRLDRNPCGSSAGSGVAVAANLCVIAIGTETDGSIVCPANNNGVVGVKPTVGLISRSGIIPISFSQDTAGPMSRTVADAVICLGALTGNDPADIATQHSNHKNNYEAHLKKDGLKDKRIGFVKGSADFHPKVEQMMQQAIIDLEKNGAEVIEVENFITEQIGNDEFEVLLYEFKDGLNNYFVSLGAEAPVRSLTELIEFNRTNKTESQFDQKLLEMAVSKGDLNSPEYKTALERMWKYSREEGIDKVMNKHQLDAIAAPTGTPAWKTDHVNGDLYMGGSSSNAAMAGYPNISVPMGMTDELPVGISFYGRAWSESVLIEIAYSYEQSTNHRRVPKFLKD